MANTSADMPASERPTGRLGHRCDFWIYYEDTDFSGFVYHANYLKFFERGREHLIGIDYLKNLYQTGVHFVVSRMDIQFKAPARHGEQVAVISEATYTRSPVMNFHQEVHLLENGNLSRLLVTADITIVCLGNDNRPVRLPPSVVSYFDQRGRMSEFSPVSG